MRDSTRNGYCIRGARGRRLAACVAGLALLGGLAGAGAPVAVAAASKATVKITAGKWDSEVEVTEAGQAPTLYSHTVEWNESFDGTYWTYERLHSVVAQSGYAPSPEQQPDCSTELRLAAGAAAKIRESQEAGKGSGYAANELIQDAEAGDQWELTTYAPDLDSVEIGGLEEGLPGEGTCSTSSIDIGWTALEGNIWPMGVSAAYEPTHGSHCAHAGDVWLLRFPSTGKHTIVEDCDTEGTVTSGEASERWKATFEETVTLSAKGSTGSAPAHKAKKRKASRRSKTGKHKAAKGKKTGKA